MCRGIGCCVVCVEVLGVCGVCRGIGCCGVCRGIGCCVVCVEV